MLVTPILPSMSVIDANVNNKITFVTIGGDQFTGYTYEITNNSTLAVVATVSVVSTASIISLTADTLTNGVEYRIRVKTTDGTNYSNYSDYMILKCYSTATVTINNLTYEDSIYKVKNQQFIFEGTYTQTQSIALKGYYYIFYDSTGNIIKQYPITYQQTGTLYQAIVMLSNETWYKVKLVCVDQNDVQTSSNLISFYVDYQSPRIRQVINLINDASTASVTIESDIRQLIFKVIGNTSFVNNAINIQDDNSYIYMDDSFTLNNNFVIQIWFNTCYENILLLKDTVNNIENSLTVFYDVTDSRFHAVKKLGTIVMEYVSEVFNSSYRTSPFSLYITQINRRMDLVAEVL